MMVVKAEEWDGDLAIRIPAPFVKAMNLSDGTTVTMTMENGQIVIRSSSSIASTYTLDELLAGINDENCHPEIKF